MWVLVLPWASMISLQARTWTNTQGRTFEADFVRLDGISVILRLPGGREFPTPLLDLSPADQIFARGGKTLLPVETVSASFGKPWPRDVRLSGPVICKVVSEDPAKKRYVYESPSYRFTCNARVTDDALRNFSVMFEATRKYAAALPLSVGGKQNQGRYDVRLFATKGDYIRAGGPPQSAGCFAQGVVMIPMESLGLKEGTTGFSLDTHMRNCVLIHELAHQLTPTTYMMPGARGGFSEGLADYVAITPYNWGYFSPDIHGESIKGYVTTMGAADFPGRNLGTTISAPRLRNFLLMSYEDFSGVNGNFNYGLGLLVTYYFFHLEDGGKATRITQFLKGLHAGAQGEAALKPLLGGSTYETLESDIASAWARMGVQIRFEIR